MNPFQPFPTFNLNGSSAASDAAEMLQTDVMRFFAILCLCLMAIFALVKALPLAQAERPTIAHPADLKAEVQSLQIRIASLKRTLAEIRTRTQFAVSDAEQSALQARKAAEDEQETLNRLQDTQQQLKQAARSLDQARSQLKTRETSMAELAAEINRKQQFQSDLQARIERETQKLMDIQNSLARTDQRVGRHQTQPPAAAPAKTTPPESPAPEGHVLRFASDAALRKLISAGKVKFYAVGGQQAWRLRLAGSRPNYTAAQNPRQIYVMEAATVPSEYSLAFRRQVAAFGRSAVTWGVTLPAQTTTDIQQIVNSRPGGELVIMPDGKVVLK